MTPVVAQAASGALPLAAPTIAPIQTGVPAMPSPAQVDASAVIARSATRFGEQGPFSLQASSGVRYPNGPVIIRARDAFGEFALPSIEGYRFTPADDPFRRRLSSNLDQIVACLNGRTYERFNRAEVNAKILLYYGLFARELTRLDPSELKVLEPSGEPREVALDLALKMQFLFRKYEGLPPYFDLRSLREITGNIIAFDPRLTKPSSPWGFGTFLSHGSSSAGIPCVARTEKLIPLGQLISMGIPVFSGEKYVYFLALEKAGNSDAISLMRTTFAGGSTLLGAANIFGTGSADLDYASRRFGWRPERSANLSEHNPLFADARRSEVMRRDLEAKLRWWKNFTEEERSMIADPFPVVYQAMRFDVKKLGYAIQTDYKDEAQYHGSLALGNEVTQIFVPMEKVEVVRRYFRKMGVDGLYVGSIEALVTSRAISASFEYKSSHLLKHKYYSLDWLLPRDPYRLSPDML